MKCNKKLQENKLVKAPNFQAYIYLSLTHARTRTQILYSDSFVSWIKTRLCICAIDGIVLTSSFAVILQLQTKKRSGLCDNPLMKPSRQQARWTAYFPQHRNCAIPIMPTQLKSLRKLICACCVCQHLCDIICHGTMQWRRKSQWASSIFTAFHNWWVLP